MTAPDDAPLKLLYVNAADAGGGGFQLAVDLMGALRRRGHPMALAVRYKQLDDPDIFEIRNDDYRWPLARLAHRALDTHVTKRNAGSASRTRRHRLAIALTEPDRLIRAARGYDDFRFPGTAHLLERCPFPPDVLHLHIAHGNYFDLRQLVALSRRLPVVLTLHDYWFITGGCGLPCGCERWRTTCGDCPQLPPGRPDRTHENRALKQSIYDASTLYVTAPSHAVARQARDSILGHARLIEAVPNGCDGHVFAPRDRAEARRRLGLPPDAIVLMAAASNPTKSKFKDWPTMLAALRRVGGRPRAEKVIALVLGTAEADAIPGLDVRGVPFVAGRDALAWHYAAADVFLHSALEETWGLVITEAMACGRPVVATGVGGIPDQVVDGETGFLVPPQSPERFADAIERLLDDAALRARMGDAAARRAHDNFTVDRVAARYEDFYARARADWLALPR